MKKILMVALSGLLVIAFCACSGKAVRPGSSARGGAAQGQIGQARGQGTRYESSYNRMPVSQGYQSRSYRKLGPLFGLNFKKFFGSFRFNINEAISDNFAAFVVVFAVLLVVGFVIFQNRKSVRKGSYR